jgi:hypothetical protein
MSEAIELYKKKEDGTMAPCGIYFCSQCRIVHLDKESAEWCHGERLCVCGKKIESMYYRSTRKCDECEHKDFTERERRAEAKRFESATKITEAEYKGEHVYLDDEYYDSVEDAIDEYLVGQEPEYVWACADHGIRTVDVEDVLTDILENMWEDADYTDLYGVDELEAALKAFNEANKSIQLWEPDYTTAILVEKRSEA